MPRDLFADMQPATPIDLLAGDASAQQDFGQDKVQGFIKSLAEKVSQYPGLQKGVGIAAQAVTPITSAVEGLRIPEIAGGLLSSGVSGVSDVSRLPMPDPMTGRAPETQPKEMPDLRKFIRPDTLSQAAYLGGEFAPLAPTGKAVVKSGVKGIKGAKDFVERLKTPNMIKDVMRTRKFGKKQSSQNFGNIMKESKELGIDRLLAKPKIDLDLIKEHGSRDEFKLLKKFTENPTIETANEAQSEAGRIARRIDLLNKKSGETPGNKNLLKEADKIKKSIRESMQHTWEQKGAEHLGKQYTDALQYHRENVIPYKNKAIKDYGNTLAKGKEGRKYADEELIKALRRDKKFMAEAGLENHPELSRKKTLAKIAKTMAKGVGVGAGYEFVKKEVFD